MPRSDNMPTQNSAYNITKEIESCKWTCTSCAVKLACAKNSSLKPWKFIYFDEVIWPHPFQHPTSQLTYIADYEHFQDRLCGLRPTACHRKTSLWYCRWDTRIRKLYQEPARPTRTSTQESRWTCATARISLSWVPVVLTDYGISNYKVSEYALQMVEQLYAGDSTALAV